MLKGQVSKFVRLLGFFLSFPSFISKKETDHILNVLTASLQKTQSPFLLIGGAINLASFLEDFWVRNLNEENPFKPIMRELPFMKMIKRIYTSLFKYVHL